MNDYAQTLALGRLAVIIGREIETLRDQAGSFRGMLEQVLKDVRTPSNGSRLRPETVQAIECCLARWPALADNGGQEPAP